MKLRKQLYLWWLWIACMLIILPMIVGCSGNALPSNETSSTFLKLLKSIANMRFAPRLEITGY